MNKWLNSQPLFEAVLIGALALVGCGDDSPCASCAEKLVATCEQALEVCDKIPLLIPRKTCEEIALDACLSD